MKILQKFMLFNLSKFSLVLMLGLSSQGVFASFPVPISNSVQGSGLIKDQQVNTLRITWSGNSDSSASNSFGQPYQVFSNNGFFVVNQTTVANNNRRVSAKLVVGTVNPFNIFETVRVPRSVLVAAERADTKIIRYVRTFTDESGGPVGTSIVTLQITPSSGGNLSISQIDLRFQNGDITMVTGTEQTVNATAVISYGGSGLLDLIWEVATPSSTSGTPIFIRLKTTRQFLGAGRRSVIESPRLPTNLTGSYILRLRVNAPTVDFSGLVLHYSVIRSSAPAAEVKTIRLVNPLPNSTIDKTTQFSWKSVSGAISYQLEIYEMPVADLPYAGLVSTDIEENQDKVLTTGILLPSDRQTTALTPMTLQYLTSGNAYYWRTLAVDSDGNLLGKSNYQKIYFTPQE